MIFQNPRAALNPIRKVGHQIEDVLRQHVQAGSDDVTQRTIDILEQVRIARPRERYHAYPFELSGGMCQRVVIALALACRPQLLIADEPTTGLDVTTQKTVMDLIVELTRERGMSTILITHDLGLAATYCERVIVMEKGCVVESAASKVIFTAPIYPYTRKLMRATPRPGVSLSDLLPEERTRDVTTLVATPTRAKDDKSAKTPLLVIEKLVKEFPGKNVANPLKRLFGRSPAAEPETFKAVDGISFTIDRGESVGLVGESRLRQIHHLDDGHAPDRQDRRRDHLRWEDIGEIPARQFARSPLRKRIQMVFQDPTDSLNPAFYRRPGDRRSDPPARRRVRPRCCPRSLRAVGPAGRPSSRSARPLSAPAFRWPKGPCRYRPCHRARPRSRHPG